MTIDTYTELDALTVAAPNLAAVRMMTGLRGISFHEAMIAQAEEWATALDEAIARETAEAAVYIRQGESTTHPNQRAAWHTESTKHLDEAARLSNVRVIAACMLTDSDQPRRPHPHKPQVAKPLLARKEKQPGRLLRGPVASHPQ